MSLPLAEQQKRWLVIHCDNSSIVPKPRSVAADGDALEFGRFRVLLRQRQLLADGIPVEIGTRAFDLLVALLEANGSLVTKNELLTLVWPGIVVSQENLKVQIAALRRVLGEAATSSEPSSAVGIGSPLSSARSGPGVSVDRRCARQIGRREARIAEKPFGDRITIHAP